MQVRGRCIAGVAQCRNDLAGLESITRLDPEAARLEVGIDGVVPAADVLDDVVAAVLVEGKAGRVLSGHLRQPVDHRDHLSFSDRVAGGCSVGQAGKRRLTTMPAPMAAPRASAPRAIQPALASPRMT